MACGTCGQQENPTEAPVVGPAVIEGNGTVIPFDSDEALDRWVEWRNTRHPGDPMTIIRAGETLAAG